MKSESVIKYVALSGGRAKGIVLGGLFEALETGILRVVKHIAGTSIGSNIATFTAFGISVKDLKEKVLDRDFREMLGTGIMGWFNRGESIISSISNLIIKTIKSSNEHSSAKAKEKLQVSLERALEDPYVSSQNIKDLFKDLAIQNTIKHQEMSSSKSFFA